MRRWVPVVLLAVTVAAYGEEPSKAARDTKIYSNNAWRWSISYPVQWTLEASDPALVRVRFPDRNASCSFNSGAMDRFNSADELTDFILANDAQFFKDRKQKFDVIDRKRITLPNRIVGNDVLAEVGPGQRSRRVYALVDGRGFAIDCETDSKNWTSVESDYQRVIASFTVRK